MAFQLPPGALDPQVTAWFMAVDHDRSGRINAKELQTALQTGNGRRFSDTACKLMIGNHHDFSNTITYIVLD